VGEGRRVNKESLRISECLRKNFLAVTVDPFRNGLKQNLYRHILPRINDRTPVRGSDTLE
jgi:hypothetical protein